MADQLVTASDLAKFLQTTFDAGQSAAADLYLKAATAVVQGSARQRLVQVAGDAITLIGTTDSWITLPERPVTAVASVALDGTALVLDTDYKRYGARLWRSDGWQETAYEPSIVAVTYTHGYADGAQALELARTYVMTLAAQVYTDPTSVTTSEAIDDYRVTYTQAMSRMILTPEATTALRRAYGRRSGLVRLG